MHSSASRPGDIAFRARFAAGRLLPVLLLVLAAAAMAQERISEYFLSCDPDSFAYIYEHYWMDHYVPCALSDGTRVWPDCRVRIRGDSSRSLPKKSLKIKTDGELFPNGNDVINLNAEWYDESYMRSILASRFCEAAGVPCFDASHARLHLNGSFFGLYVEIENMDELFLTRRGLDPDGNLYKATYDGACLSVYEDVYVRWEKKAGDPSDWTDLEELIAALDSVPDAGFRDWAQGALDYPEILSIVAGNALLANGSTYYHNYYMYHDVHGTGRWMMFPWDMDKTFGHYGGSYDFSRTSPDWLHDNPLPERIFALAGTFGDLKSRAEELMLGSFSLGFFTPLVDSMMPVIEASVVEDLTDNCPDLAFWTAMVQEELDVGVTLRRADLQDQLDHKPRGFLVDPLAGSTPDSVRLSWHSSSDPNGLPLTYTVRYCRFSTWDEEDTVSYPGIVDTFFTLPATPAEGSYYWKVLADNGNVAYEVEGWDSYNRFAVDFGTVAPTVISEDATWTSYQGPFFVNQDMLVESGATLTILAGTEIRLAGDVSIVIRGNIQAEGTPYQPVRIHSQQDGVRWGALCFEAASAPSLLGNVVIEGASQGTSYAWRRAAVSSHQSDISLENVTFTGNLMCVYLQEADFQALSCSFLDNNDAEHINLRDATARVEDCEFLNITGGDAVDFDNVQGGVIRGCIISGGDDDLIDIGEGSVALLEGNRIHGAADKGVSVGERSDATLLRNAISGCDLGVAVKDSSFVLVDRCTLYDNRIALSAYEKNLGEGGGTGTAVSSIFSASQDADLDADELSTNSVSWSLSDTAELPGVGCLLADPAFLDAAGGNFHLDRSSPCIDAGDPAGEEDPDGTQQDMGAFFYNLGHEWVVINEINYNSAPEFDPGDWVELFNPGELTLDMEGLRFRDSANAYEIPEGAQLPAHGYMVLCTDLSAFQVHFPGVTNALGDLGFGFSGSGEFLVLSNAQGQVLDYVNYGDDPPWPTEPDGNGPTLELIDPEMDNALPESWGASFGHGTPGAINSVTDPTALPGDEALPFPGLRPAWPNPFNPRCTLRFVLDEPGEVSLQIHDLRGRRLRVLVDRRLEAGVHERVWDGRDEAGRRLSSGVYLLRYRCGSQRQSRKIVLIR